MSNYDDIINLPHHVSTKRKQMSIEARSAQFAPFAALTGYDEKVKETSRLTEKKHILDEGQKEILKSASLDILDELKLIELINDNGLKNQKEFEEFLWQLTYQK